MKPGKPLVRKTKLNPSTTRIGRNRKRTKANHARAYGEKRAWVVTLPCLVCGFVPSEPAHVGNGGLSRKSGSENLVPLCGPRPDRTGPLHAGLIFEGHHRESHAGIKTFQRKYNIDLKAEAARLDREWTQLQQGQRDATD